MVFEFNIISTENYRDWFTKHYASLHHRSPYHHPNWLEASSSGVGFETHIVGIYEGGEMVAALPGYETRRGPFRLFGSPLRGTMTSSLGPVALKPIKTAAEMVSLIQACGEYLTRQHRIHYSRFALRNPPEGDLPPLKSGWTSNLSGSYRLDISPGVEAVWNGLKSDCRRNIKKAQQMEIELVPFDDYQHFYQMIDETYRRHRSSSWHPQKFFRNMFTDLVPNDLMWAWGARYEGEIIAACLFLHDDHEVHFVSGASLPHFGNLPTSYLLHWTAIETAIQNGLSVYNSDASEVRSIDQFKESFRPVLEKRFTLTWSPKHVRIAQDIFLAGTTYFRKIKGAVRSISSPAGAS